MHVGLNRHLEARDPLLQLARKKKQKESDHALMGKQWQSSAHRIIDNDDI